VRRGKLMPNEARNARMQWSAWVCTRAEQTLLLVALELVVR